MRRALGKGLSQLIGEQFDNAINEAPVESIEANRWQPRSVFDDDALHELAASIREVGVLQPLVVRPLAEGRFELIEGRVVMHAGATRDHERIAKRVFICLHVRCDPEIYDVNKGDFGVRIRPGRGRGSILYPDVVVDLQRKGQKKRNK